jgi:tyramine---L-glutamate ligase
MKQLFVYEYLSGGGVIDDDESATNELMRMGVAMRDALQRDLQQLDDCVATIATCARVAPPSAPVATAVAAPDEPPFEFVARMADRHDLTWVVAPETGGLLEGFSRVVDPARWLGCDSASIHLAAGKRATLMRLAEHGIPTPLAFSHVPEVDRWVVKPDDGAGAVATRVHANQEAAWDDWSQRSRGGVAMSIEPWVPGEPLSLSLLCQAGRAEMLSVNRQHIVVDRAGVVSFHGVEPNVLTARDPRLRPLRAMASQIAQHIPGLSGFVGVDVVWHAHCGPVAIEVNPRVTCAYIGLSAALGRNLAGDILQAHAEASHGPL